MDMNDRALREIVCSLGGVANGYPREAGFEDGSGARRGASVGRTGFQGDVDRRAMCRPPRFTESPQRFNLGVRLTGRTVVATGDDPVIMHDHRADRRVWTRPTDALRCLPQCQPHEMLITLG